MHSLIFSVLLQVNTLPLMIIMMAFIAIAGLLLVCTLTFFLYKRKKESNQKGWEQNVASLISTAIFYNEDDSEFVDIISENKELLQNPIFRQYLINELIHARKDISGSSALNLKRLYEILDLNKDSFEKLNSKKWHIKSKGIQELAIMEQVKYVKEIFRLTNNENELVRNEAQAALANFYGFLGLRFLNVTAYTISEWQQIQLLNKLHGATPKNFDIIKKWLQSSNESVVNFSLRLATFYNLFDVYPDVLDCLSNNNLQVKLNTLNYLRKIPQAGTAARIIGDYSFESKTYKLAIINTLYEIGDKNQINFLLKRLHDQDNDIKVAAAKSLSHLHPSGASFLKAHLFADENPWKSIFHQIENESVA